MLKYGDQSPEGLAFKKSLVKAGLVSALFDYMNTCGDQEFILESNGDIEYPDYKTAPISPAYWLSMLSATMMETFSPEEADREQIRLEIAAGIGPVVQCLCNDLKREFFKS